MNDKLRIPAGAWLLVGDGRKALILVNEGNERFPDLRVRDIFSTDANPSSHDQGSDAPVRAMWGGQAGDKSAGRRAAKNEIDWHDLAEERFARDVVDALGREHGENPIEALIIVAPPRALADIRKALPAALADIVIAEIDKDLTKHPVYEIERLVLAE